MDTVPLAVCTSNVWLLIKIMPKAIVFSVLFCSALFISFPLFCSLFFSFHFTSNVPAALPTSVLRFQQPQPHNGEALPQQCWVSLPGGGSGDQLHHGLQEQLLVLGAGENLPEGQPQGTPHGPHQGSKERLNRLSPASQRCWVQPNKQGSNQRVEPTVSLCTAVCCVTQT